MRIIHGGEEAFTAAISGIPDPINRQYFAQQVEAAKSLIGNAFGEYGKRFVQGAQQMYERYNSDRSIELAKAALNQVVGIFQANIIRRIDELSYFQIATPVMQRWIMANPTARQMYHEQLLDGYSDSYNDQEPTKIGKDHYDWRRVMNGMVVLDNEGWYADQYMEELHVGDEELSSYDQFRIINTWDALENILAQGLKDPTSPWNNDM